MYKKHIYKFFMFISLVALSYLTFYIVLLENNNLNGQYWIKNVEYVKDAIAEQYDKEERILIFAGSNAMFGFDSLLIEEKFDKKCINMAFNAGVPFSYIVHKIQKHANRGDAILLPLEYIHYFNEEYTTNTILDMFTWNKKYFYELDFVEKIKVIFAYTNNKILLEAIASNFSSKNIPKGVLREKKISREEVLVRFKQSLLDVEKKIMYRFDTLNQRGDVFNNYNQANNISKQKAAYFNTSDKLSTSFIKHSKELQEFALKNNIEIYYLHPSTMKNKLFNLKKAQDKLKIEKLVLKLNEHNVTIIGDPKRYNFDIKYMYNTTYHLNQKGAKLRTQNVIEDIKSLMIND